MQTKSLVWLGFFIGSGIGSYLPLLWGGNLFSFTSIILSAVGGLAGIYVFYKISQ